MKRNIDEFLEEITNNFSELFVETFLIRYLNEFNKNELLKQIGIVKRKLNKKIDKKFNDKLVKLNIKDDNRF